MSLVALAACAGLARRHPGAPTGTCAGACAHYVDCKGTPEDDAMYGACVDECREIYDDPQTLAAYEQLACEDAVAFIEGQRGPVPSGLADSTEAATASDEPTAPN
jgi:hypothetical protein